MIKTITSLQHPLVKHLVRLRYERDYRHEQQSILMEGIKPIQEVATFLKRLVYVDTFEGLKLEAPEVWIVTEAMMKKISGMTTPEGVLAEVQMPALSSLSEAHWIVAFDGVSDPGNLGTLLRTALALGWEGAFILPNSCDPFNDKALRAARGAHFRLPLAMGTAKELQALVGQNQLTSFVADLVGEAPQNLTREERRLLVLGNEAHGASKEVRQFCRPVTIPMPGEMESLNVAIAGGILMYLLKNSS